MMAPSQLHPLWLFLLSFSSPFIDLSARSFFTPLPPSSPHKAGPPFCLAHFRGQAPVICVTLVTPMTPESPSSAQPALLMIFQDASVMTQLDSVPARGTIFLSLSLPSLDVAVNRATLLRSHNLGISNICMLSHVGLLHSFIHLTNTYRMPIVCQALSRHWGSQTQWLCSDEADDRKTAPWYKAGQGDRDSEQCLWSRALGEVRSKLCRHLGKKVPGRGNSMWKGPEARASWQIPETASRPGRLELREWEEGGKRRGQSSRKKLDGAESYQSWDGLWIYS